MHPKTFFGMAGGALATLCAFLWSAFNPHGPQLDAAEVAAITTVFTAFGSALGGNNVPPPPPPPPVRGN